MFHSSIKTFVGRQCFLDCLSNPNITSNNLLAEISNVYSSTEHNFRDVLHVTTSTCRYIRGGNLSVGPYDL